MTEQKYQAFKEFINKVLYEILTLDDYDNLMRRLGANKGNGRYSTICHNIDNGKFNLSFEPNTRSFYCFSECNDSYNLLTLVKRRFELLGEPKTIFASLKWICEQIGIEFNFTEDNVKKDDSNKYNWQSNIGKYKRNKNASLSNEVYDKNILRSLDEIYYKGWIDEGISIEIHNKFGVKFYKYRQQIVIPIFDDNGNFVGTHCRNLKPSLIEQGFKYDHLRLLDGSEYKFHMGMVLFGLNMNKYNIEKTKEVIIFESPKSVMIYDGLCEINNSVAIFGMNLQIYKIKLLLTYGCTKFTIALDRQYKEENSKEFERYQKKINKMIASLRPYAEEIGIVWDRDEDRMLDYRDSPIDKGIEVWSKLYENREII